VADKKTTMTSSEIEFARHLRIDHGLTLKEIAERMGLSMYAVKEKYRKQIEG